MFTRTPFNENFGAPGCYVSEYRIDLILGKAKEGGGGKERAGNEWLTAIYGLYKAVCVFNKFRKTLWKVDQNENAYISYQRSRSKTHQNEKDDRKYYRRVCP